MKYAPGGICVSARTHGTFDRAGKEQRETEKDPGENGSRLRDEDRVILRQREKKGLLAGMYEFPNEEGLLTPEEASKSAGDESASYADPEAGRCQAYFFSCGVAYDRIYDTGGLTDKRGIRDAVRRDQRGGEKVCHTCGFWRLCKISGLRIGNEKYE